MAQPAPTYGQPQGSYPPPQGGQPQYGGQPQHGVAQQPAVVVVQAQPVPQQILAQDPEQYRTCGIVTSLIFTIVVFFGNIIGLGSDMIRFESDTTPEFQGGISHYDARFVKGGVVILDARIDAWSSVPPLGAMVPNYEWSSAMIILSLLLSIPIIVIQICRLCRKIRHRKLWTYLTGTLSIVNVILMLISYGNIYSSTQDHLQDLNSWLLVHGGISHVRAGGSSGFVAVILFSYLCSIVIFGFGIRTCVGRKCQDGCCCEWCTCNLAEDETFKGAARRAASYEAGGAQGDPEGNQRTDRTDVYASGAL